MEKYWITSIVLGAAMTIAAAAFRVTSTAGAASPNVTEAAAILIDHNSVDAAQIPQPWLDAVRNLDTFFAHKSVGTNILDGMEDLQSQSPGRYTININGSDGPPWYIANSGILHRSLGTNGEPQTKIDGFDDFVRGGFHTADAVMMKFCPGDTLPFGTVPAADIWASYRDMMAGLEQAYPDTTIVWWTMPIAIAADDRGNDEKEIFNGLMRDYCETNSCVLFDIADIESHDPEGNPVISQAGYEAMWGGYASDGAHLNDVGGQRVASALWWLLARVAGWDPELPPDPDFTLSASPELVEVVQGNSADYTVSIEPTGGFAQPVQLNTTGLPADTSVSWSINPLPPNQESTMTIAVSNTVPPGDYPFTIAGTAGMLTDQVTATLRVLESPPDPDFTLDVAPEAVVVVRGDTAAYSVSVQAIGGFANPVQLDTTGLPADAAVSWGINPLPPDQATTMKVDVKATVPIDDYHFNIVGTTAEITKVVTATLNVRQPTFLPIVLR